MFLATTKDGAEAVVVVVVVVASTVGDVEDLDNETNTDRSGSDGLVRL